MGRLCVILSGGLPSSALLNSPPSPPCTPAQLTGPESHLCLFSLLLLSPLWKAGSGVGGHWGNHCWAGLVAWLWPQGPPGHPHVEPLVLPSHSRWAKISQTHIRGSHPQALHYQAAPAFQRFFPHFLLSHVLPSSPFGPVCLLTPCLCYRYTALRGFPSCKATRPVPSPGRPLPPCPSELGCGPRVTASSPGLQTQSDGSHWTVHLAPAHVLP